MPWVPVLGLLLSEPFFDLLLVSLDLRGVVSNRLMDFLGWLPCLVASGLVQLMGEKGWGPRVGLGRSRTFLFSVSGHQCSCVPMMMYWLQFSSGLPRPTWSLGCSNAVPSPYALSRGGEFAS